MYHRIADDPFDPWADVVSPTNFREQMEWLTANRTLMRLTEFAGLHRSGALPRDAVAVTIDDGYSCVSEIAAPLLEKLGIPATVFISPEIIRKGKFWWNELQSIVLDHDGTSLEVDGYKFVIGDSSPGDQVWAPLTPPSTPRQRAYVEIQTMLSRLAPDELNRSMDELRGLAQAAPDVTKRPMSPDEIRRTASDLVEFGSHSMTHAWLPSLPDDEQHREIVDSLEECQDLTGHKPSAFAYPYGMFDNQTKKAVAAAGFDCACTTQNLAVSSRSPTYALPRLAVANCGGSSLVRALNRSCLA